MIIAIDGPAGSGKSTTAKLVAERLNILHLDTGAMYRCITLKALRMGIPVADEKALGEMSRKTRIEFEIQSRRQTVLMDQEDVTDAIRTPEVTSRVSEYCAVPVVREVLVKEQRRIGRSRSSVLEGRDIGTVVFPEAEHKFYLVASIEERAKRRQMELSAKGIHQSVEDLQREIAARDLKDSSRCHSPLRKAKDALLIDTSNMTIAEQVDAIIRSVEGKKHLPQAG